MRNMSDPPASWRAVSAPAQPGDLDAVLLSMCDADGAAARNERASEVCAFPPFPRRTVVRQLSECCASRRRRL